jgi:DNA (cytosine-5)-methyltransferase 1
MNYLSVCSGIEAATVAWHPLGWNPVGFGEIEKFPCQVLAHHYPEVPNFGDMTKFKEWQIESDVNVLVGGTPCQSFSVAGLRKGLDDPRGNLMLTYLAIAAKYRPQWLVWENVPGVLSSNGGLDFASLLRGMGELGYGFAYRVLDAQYFGVAQRRRRVFVVGYLGSWQRAAAVLFERHSLCGYPAPSREKGKSASPSVTTGAPFSRTGNDRVEAEAMVVWPAAISSTLDTTFGTKQGLENQHVNAGCPMFVPAVANTLGASPSCHSSVNVASGQGDVIAFDVFNQDLTGQVSKTVASRNDQDTASCIAIQDVRPMDKMQNGRGWNNDGTAYTVDTHATQGVALLIPLNSMNCFRSPDADASTGCGIGDEGEAMYTITKTNSHAVAQPIPFDTTQITSKANYSKPKAGDPCHPLAAGAHPPAIAQPIAFQQTADCLTAAYGTKWNGNASATNGSLFAAQAMAVRRLTLTECERLQGFPDGYTDIRHGGKATPDGPRYKALGNSMAVPVMAWIGKRIQEVEAIHAP